MKITKYPDGSSYVISDKGDPVVIRINTYEDLWHLNQFVDAYKSRTKGKIPTITIPNLIDAQADRRFADNQSSGLKLVCQFLNNMNANFKIFHPHNPEVVEALMDNVEIIDNSKFIEKVIDKLELKNKVINNVRADIGNTILMSSDAGGFKPLMKLCDKINWKGSTYSASKYRPPNGDPLMQVVDREDFDGQDILIVDDICVYGGTFKGLSKLLRERNCGKLYLAVSHMTVDILGEDPVTNYFDKVFTTNSKYDNYYQKVGSKGGFQPSNLEIIKLF